jgi:hypothetical protein
MTTSSPLKVRCIAVALVIAVQAMPYSASGQSTPPDSDDARIKASVQTIKAGEVSERGAATKFLIEHWEKALPALVTEIGALDRGTATTPSDPELASVLPITDALRAILVNKDGSIQAFRTTPGKDKAVRTLIWGARSGNQPLRINSTYSLANVTDNTTLCYVLDHLQDKQLSPDGRVNLLQVAMPVASYAYSENFDATKITIAAVRDTIKNSKEKFEQTAKLASDLETRVNNSINKSEHLPSQISMCNSYTPKFGKLRE